MTPSIVIKGHDYTRYVSEAKPTRNDLDADGAGRDIHSGTMFRSKIGEKMTWEVEMNEMDETLAAQLSSDLSTTYTTLSYLDPRTNTIRTGTYYCSSVDFGTQMYKPVVGKTYYTGITFTLIER